MLQLLIFVEFEYLFCEKRVSLDGVDIAKSTLGGLISFRCINFIRRRPYSTIRFVGPTLSALRPIQTWRAELGGTLHSTALTHLKLVG